MLRSWISKQDKRFQVRLVRSTSGVQRNTIRFPGKSGLFRLPEVPGPTAFWDRALWKVAWCFFDERTQKHKAHQWVEERLRRLLEGKVDAVIRGMRYQATQRGLKGQERKTVRGAAEYFERNRDRMKYDEYLAAGYPIGSGVVEGACRHLVKDRMERTGMRWLPSGAQAMLDLRATYLNGEWNAFWPFHVTQEDQRLYGKIRKAG